jgi:transposase
LFVTWCRESRIEAYVTLANTIEAWRKEILNYAASGPTSAAQLLDRDPAPL